MMKVSGVITLEWPHKTIFSREGWEARHFSMASTKKVSVSYEVREMRVEGWLLYCCKVVRL